MNITSASNANLLHVNNSQANNIHENVGEQLRSTNSINCNDDTSSLSSEGKMQAIAYSLESLQLSSWSGDFKAEVHDLSYSDKAISESRDYMRKSDELAKDGSLSIKDQQALQSYIHDNMTATQNRKNVEAFYTQHKSEFDEFELIHRNHTEDAKKEYGILTTSDYQEKVLNVEGNNQSLRQSIIQRMFNDTRAVELMNKLGIGRPA